MTFEETAYLVRRMRERGLIKGEVEGNTTEKQLTAERSNRSYYRHRDAILERKRARYAARKAAKEASE